MGLQWDRFGFVEVVVVAPGRRNSQEVTHMFRELTPASPPPFIVSVVSCSYFRHCSS